MAFPYQFNPLMSPFMQPAMSPFMQPAYPSPYQFLQPPAPMQQLFQQPQAPTQQPQLQQPAVQYVPTFQGGGGGGRNNYAGPRGQNRGGRSRGWQRGNSNNYYNGPPSRSFGQSRGQFRGRGRFGSGGNGFAPTRGATISNGWFNVDLCAAPCTYYLRQSYAMNVNVLTNARQNLAVTYKYESLESAAAQFNQSLSTPQQQLPTAITDSLLSEVKKGTVSTTDTKARTQNVHSGNIFGGAGKSKLSTTTVPLSDKLRVHLLSNGKDIELGLLVPQATEMQCPMCSCTYKSQGGVINHIEKKHNLNVTIVFFCRYCGDNVHSFPSKRCCNKHVKDSHSDKLTVDANRQSPNAELVDKPIRSQCDKCKALFPTHPSMGAHRRTCGINKKERFADKVNNDIHAITIAKQAAKAAAANLQTNAMPDTGRITRSRSRQLSEASYTAPNSPTSPINLPIQTHKKLSLINESDQIQAIDPDIQIQPSQSTQIPPPSEHNIGEASVVQSQPVEWWSERTMNAVFKHRIMQKMPNCIFLDSIVWQKLPTEANSNLRNYVNLPIWPVNTTHWKYCFIPLHREGCHWGLVILDKITATARYIDSIYTTLKEGQLEDIAAIWKKLTANGTELTFAGKTMRRFVQKDSISCGPATCIFAEKFIAGESLQFAYQYLSYRTEIEAWLPTVVDDDETQDLSLLNQQFNARIQKVSKVNQLLSNKRKKGETADKDTSHPNISTTPMRRNTNSNAAIKSCRPRHPTEYQKELTTRIHNWSTGNKSWDSFESMCDDFTSQISDKQGVHKDKKPDNKTNDKWTQTYHQKQTQPIHHNEFRNAEKSSIQKLYIRNKRKALRRCINNDDVKCNLAVEDVAHFYQEEMKARSINMVELEDNCPSVVKLTKAASDNLNNPISSEEIVTTLKSMRNSAPGTDNCRYKDLLKHDPGGLVLPYIYKVCQTNKRYQAVGRSRKRYCYTRKVIQQMCVIGDPLRCRKQ